MRRVLLCLAFAIFSLSLIYVAINPADFGMEGDGHLVFGKPRFEDMDNYFIHHGQNQTGANNIVTSIVFDYRGFDTLGEASVLFTAVLAVGMVLRSLRRDVK